MNDSHNNSHSMPKTAPKSTSKKSRRSKRILQDIGDKIELPGGLLSGDVHIELNSNREMIIDGRCSVLEYSDTVIRISTKSGIVRLCGFSLNIVTMSPGCVEICGKLCSLEFTD